VLETLEFVEMFKNDELFYPQIERFAWDMARGARSVFTMDVNQLSVLKWQLEAGTYKISTRGRTILCDRLFSVYSDGVEYRIATRFLRDVKIEPIIDSKLAILKSEKAASEAKFISKEIGRETGIEVTMKKECNR